MTQSPLDHSESAPYLDILGDIVDAINCGPWRFIQLRGAPLSRADIDQGDVDLLGSRASANLLLKAARSCGSDGKCHFWIKSRDANKISAAFISLDGKHVLRFDLWINLPQIQGRSHLRYVDLEKLLAGTDCSIRRLPTPVEAAIYIHHLKAKQKDIASFRVQQRITHYANICSEAGAADLNTAFALITRMHVVAKDALDIANRHLECARILPSPETRSRWQHKISTEFSAALLAPPRKIRHIAIMGCDGSGKTTLTKNHAAQGDGGYFTFTGKRLYRNSLIYKLLVIVVRPLLLQGREKFDDVIAPWNYVRAIAALEAKIWVFPRGVTLIDRSTLDFLVVDRKSDQPRFHPATKFLSKLGRRIPTIHLFVPDDVLQSRKAEMTTVGHAKYDQLIFDHATQRSPSHYTAFHNGADACFSKAAFANVLKLVAKY